MKILGIETSCDETAVAVVEGELNSSTPLRILSSVVASSAELQAKYGGVIPEQAAREQVRAIIPTLRECLTKANPKFEIRNPKIDAIAITVGPGLVGSLLVGVETARTLACVWKKPIIPVNHLAAHVYANWVEVPQVVQVPEVSEVSEVSRVSRGVGNISLSSPLRPDARRDFEGQVSLRNYGHGLPLFPAVAVVISGGHSDMVLMRDHNKLRWIGGTRDDAAGECFDKCARLLGLPYPGGPNIAKLADKWMGKNSKFEIRNSKLNLFPRPLVDQDTYDWSFSGLKTAVAREVSRGRRGRILGYKDIERLSERTKERLAAEIQEAICDSLVNKLVKAIERYKPKSVLVAGGVAANKRLKEKVEERIKIYDLGIKKRIDLFIPPAKLCTDNGSYIAAYAFYHYSPVPWEKVKVEPGLTIMGES